MTYIPRVCPPLLIVLALAAGCADDGDDPADPGDTSSDAAADAATSDVLGDARDSADTVIDSRDGGSDEPSTDGDGLDDADAADGRDAGVALANDAIETCMARAEIPFGNAVSPEDERFRGMCRFLFDTYRTETIASWPPAEFLLQLMEDEPEVFGNQFEAFGFAPDPESDFPFGFVRGTEDPSRVHETCALCHSGALPDGTRWLGRPSTALRFGDFKVAVHERWVAAGNDPYMSELEIEKDRQLGAGRAHAESSDFPRLVPADYPVYYNLDERTAQNHLGTGRNLWTEAHFAVFAFGAGRPNDEEAEVKFPSDAHMEELVAFIGGIRAPEPPPQDAELVARGETVFAEARCGSCHHPDAQAEDGVIPIDVAENPDDRRDRFPGDDPEWPRGSIATSPDHSTISDEVEGDRERVQMFLQFIFEHGLAVRQSDGYRTPNLRGVWESAPYLHNGSVPTLEDLLSPPDERPTEWMNGEFLVDTTVRGNGNQGHTFGTELSDEDKEALIAFLRSL